MAWSESDVKTDMVKQVKELGGYARRIEDQYAVGMFDMIIAMPNMPVLFVEVKLIPDNMFGPSPRQYIEGLRLDNGGHACAMPLLIGFKSDPNYYFTPFEWVAHADRRRCFGAKDMKLILQETEIWARTVRRQRLSSTLPRKP